MLEIGEDAGWTAGNIGSNPIRSTMTTWVYVIYEKKPNNPPLVIGLVSTDEKLERVLERLRSIRKKSLFYADRFLVDGIF